MAELIEVSKLKSHPRNAELFDDTTGERWRQTLESIKESGVHTPVIITRDFVIVSGHQRVRACKELGIGKVPCHFADFEESHRLSVEDQILKQLIESNMLQRGIGSLNKNKAVLCWNELQRLNGIRKGSANPKGTNQYTKKSGEPQLADDQMTREEIAETYFHKSVDTLDRWQMQIDLLSQLDPTGLSLLEEHLINDATAIAFAKLPIEEQERILENFKSSIKEDYGEEGIDYSEHYDPDDDREDIRYERNELASYLNMWYKENKKLKNKQDKWLAEKKRMEEYEERTGLKWGYKKCDRCNEAKREHLFYVFNGKNICNDCVPDEDEDNNEQEINNIVYLDTPYHIDVDTSEIDTTEPEEANNKLTPEEKEIKELKDSTIFFCARVNDFIEKTNKYVSLADKINSLPDYERNGYINAIKSIHDWVYQMEAGIENIVDVEVACIISDSDKNIEQQTQSIQSISEIDPPEYRTKILQDNKEQWPISKIFLMLRNDAPRRDFYRELERKLGLIDKDDKILLSYEDYEMFITEYDPSKANEPERTISRINKIKKSMESA